MEIKSGASTGKMRLRGSFMGIFQRLKQRFLRKKQPVRLGIALGSGGAKGMAHLGALKAFEEAGITFSFVAGTSIGAVVGALLAKGYSSEDMRRIVEAVNRREFSKNLRPFVDLSFAERFLENYLEGDFTTLRIPFAACATDGKDNRLVVLRKGKLARAVTASSAIPPLFKAVEIDGRELYDGAFTNAIPADVCRALGAEFVIGIDLGAFSKPEEEKGRFNPAFWAPHSRTSSPFGIRRISANGVTKTPTICCVRPSGRSAPPTFRRRRWRRCIPSAMRRPNDAWRRSRRDTKLLEGEEREKALRKEERLKNYTYIYSPCSLVAGRRARAHVCAAFLPSARLQVGGAGGRGTPRPLSGRRAGGLHHRRIPFGGGRRHRRGRRQLYKPHSHGALLKGASRRKSSR